MMQKKLDKNVVFYIAGQKGSVFTLQAGNFCDDQMINQALNHLEDEMESPISWTEERRKTPRAD